MRVFEMRSVVLAGLTVLWLSGCGDHNNVLGGLADDHSIQAKIQNGQTALDRGDCQTAIDNFTEVFDHDPNDADARINLAAAYTCRAGFNVTALIHVAADFGAGTITNDQLFQTIADKAVETISSTWPADLSTAKGLLAQDPNAHPPLAFKNNPDAGFKLSIVSLVQAVLTVVDILNYADGVADCVQQQGSNAFANCQISPQDATDIINALQDSAQTLTDLGVASDVTDSVNTVLTDMNSATPSDPISCPDILQYLQNQGIVSAGQATCT
ncbi:MAG TPA: hypothetical protein VLY20_03025 [Nitrospiria bacterium]|nr:hypothetical protein [Nitrospiria bacterium]HUK55611.1 hypothetical protein [Nitrospiria bacterium]